MNMKSIRRQLAAKGVAVKDALSSWKTYVPNAELYVVDGSGAIRRRDVLAAGGRRELRRARREKRRKRIGELKARRVA